MLEPMATRRSARLGILVGAALLLLAAGCSTNYDGIVRVEDAPLFGDESRTIVIARMKRFDDVYLGHSAPESNPLKAKWHDLKGYANAQDLRIFSYPNNDYARGYAVAQNRREVVLEGKDWPEPTKQAIRENRIENGMTKEQVELAWGRPNSVRPLPPAGEQWVWDRNEVFARDEVAYYGWPGGSRFYYAYPYGWGYAWDWPYYEPIYYRMYYSRLRRLSATFNEQGIVTGWDSNNG
jgi:hypothetical protein